MDNSHGKEIDLQKTTIKIPGANKPRIGKSVQSSEANRLNNEINLLNLNNPQIIISNGDGSKITEELGKLEFYLCLYMSIKKSSEIFVRSKF